jgi:hypothetical protein
VFAGSPFFANPQSALLFPLTWIALLIPTAPALALIAISKVAATGVAMYVFLRLRALHPLAALMGATSFMWSGLLVVWLQWSYASTLMFFPLLLLRWVAQARDSGPMAILALIAASAQPPCPRFLLGLASAGAWAFYRAGAGARLVSAARVAWASLASIRSCLSSVCGTVPCRPIDSELPPLRVAPVGHQLSDAVLLQPAVGCGAEVELRGRPRSASALMLLPGAGKAPPPAFFGLSDVARPPSMARYGEHGLLRHQTQLAPCSLSALRLPLPGWMLLTTMIMPWLYRCEVFALVTLAFSRDVITPPYERADFWPLRVCTFSLC